MKVKNSLFIISFLLILCLNFNHYGVAYADGSSNKNANGIPFTVVPIMPKNQDPNVQSYFKLKAKPGEIQTVFVQVENLKKEPISIQIESDNALTSTMGEIQYVPGKGNENSKIMDPSFEMRDSISVQQEIHLKSGEKKEIPISIRAPKSNRGTYLGGVTFIASMDGTKTYGKRDDKAYYFDIENRIGFSLAIQWDMPISEGDVFSIEKAGIRLIPSGVQSYIEIQNNNASILADFSAKYHIKKKDGTELFQGRITSVNFSPKTSIRYPIMWKGSELMSGNFILEVEAKVGDQIQIKNVEFAINSSFIQQYINETGNGVVLQQDGLSKKKILIGTIGLIIVFAGALALGSKNRYKGKDNT